MRMHSSLDRLVKTVVAVVVTLAIALTLLTLLAARRMERASDQLMLSQAQLESALRLRAAPYVAAGDVPALLDRYAGQIDAEDRLATSLAGHRRERIERGDLAGLRTALGHGSDTPALDALTRRIVARESAEMAEAQAGLARSERLVMIAVAVVGLILLGAAALLIAVLRSAILQPIRLLIAAVEQLRSGDLETPVADPMPKEFDRLATDFNAMAAHIAEQQRALAGANARLAERVIERTRALAEALGLDLDRDMRNVSCGGRTASLTERECELLALLLERQGRTVSREQVLTAAWQTAGEASDNLVDVYVGYLRRKLRAIRAPWEIRTVRGAGFVLRQHMAGAALSLAAE